MTTAAPAAPPPPPAASPSGPATEDAESAPSKGEPIEIQGSAPKLYNKEVAAADIGDVLQKTEAISVSGASQPLRLAVSLTGGLAVDHGAHSLLALDARLDHGRGYGARIGVDASLWFADGLATTGRGLVTIATRVVPQLELGFGGGIQLGNGTGPAGSLQLRLDTPLPWLAATLRYDAALLFNRPVSVEHVFTLGLELSY